MKDFTNLYQLSKTLRFELIPQGKTLEIINKKGLINDDKRRAESYQKMKKTIDEFHKYFIDMALSNVSLSLLDEFHNLYFASIERKKEDSYKKKLEKVQASLRKEIAEGFKTGEAKEIFSKISKKNSSQSYSNIG
ncbi:hypothetical protein FGE20_09690 [Elizabethkingia sp. JS20170427COW]|nr:hypothetical protein [Elizabethkingia sp. JS20170427COW]QCX53984.1 hypothetical protein FGE20_09690 [Elizabethkingia sp. JS20170427COW]